MSTSPAQEFSYAYFLEETGRILHDPAFYFEVRPEWRAARGDDHRLHIRKALARRLHDPSVLDLSALPANGNLSISISHCRAGGGYALASSRHTLGFDLEDASRIKPAIVARVSMETEIAEAPTPAFLWAAKEATYKAMRGPNQPLVISDLMIGSWRSAAALDASLNTGNLWMFEAFQTSPYVPVPGKGVIFQLGDLIYAFFSRFGST